MKLYTDIGGQAPSPRRVRIFIAEKGLEVALEEMKLHEQNRTDAFRKKKGGSAARAERCWIT